MTWSAQMDLVQVHHARQDCRPHTTSSGLEARSSQFDDVISAAYHPQRLQACLPPGLPPVLVLTIRGLQAAREAVGRAASPLQLLDRLARMQDIDPDGPCAPAALCGPEQAMLACAFVPDNLACHNSVAMPSLGTVLVNDSACSHLVRTLRDGDDLGLRADDFAFFALSHEAAHVVEHRQGWIQNAAWHGLHSMHVRHLEECFADSYAVLSMRAANMPEHRVLAAYAHRRATLLMGPAHNPHIDIMDAGCDIESLLHPGIYATPASVAMALELARPGMNAHDIAAAALACREEGGLPGHMLETSSPGYMAGAEDIRADTTPYGHLVEPGSAMHGALRREWLSRQRYGRWLDTLAAPDGPALEWMHGPDQAPMDAGRASSTGVRALALVEAGWAGEPCTTRWDACVQAFACNVLGLPDSWAHDL